MSPVIVRGGNTPWREAGASPRVRRCRPFRQPRHRPVADNVALDPMTWRRGEVRPRQRHRVRSCRPETRVRGAGRPDDARSLRPSCRRRRARIERHGSPRSSCAIMPPRRDAVVPTPRRGGYASPREPLVVRPRPRQGKGSFVAYRTQTRWCPRRDHSKKCTHCGAARRHEDCSPAGVLAPGVRRPQAIYVFRTTRLHNPFDDGDPGPRPRHGRLLADACRHRRHAPLVERDCLPAGRRAVREGRLPRRALRGSDLTTNGEGASFVQLPLRTPRPIRSYALQDRLSVMLAVAEGGSTSHAGGPAPGAGGSPPSGYPGKYRRPSHHNCIEQRRHARREGLSGVTKANGKQIVT